jgi:hypothetical protein
MTVNCEVQEVTLYSQTGRPISGVRVVCSRCEHEAETFGTGQASVRRCLALLREECPTEEDNYYVADQQNGELAGMGSK